jgi:hypothetical protein
MHKLTELKDKLTRELEDYADNGKFSEKDVESIKYMTSAIDHLCNIIGDEEDEYSGVMMNDDLDGRYSRRGGMSYARGRGSNARRDSRGRYSSRMYSGDNSMMLQELRELKEDAPDERTRMEFDKFIKKMESM